MTIKKKYGVCIGYLSIWNIALFECATAAEARKSANAYRKAWGIHDKIVKVVLIPDDIQELDEQREYVVNK